MIQKKQLIQGQQVVSSENGQPVVAYYAMPANYADSSSDTNPPTLCSNFTAVKKRKPILNWLACRPLNSNEEDVKMNSFLNAIRSNKVEDVKSMIEDGVDPNLPNYSGNGEIPIIEATYSGSVDVIRYLLSVNVNVNLRNLMGESAIHIAAQSNYFNPEILKLYFDYADSDLNIQDRVSGHTPLHILTKNCAFDKYSEFMRTQSLALMRYLLPECNVHKRNFRGESAIHLCVDGNIENVSLLEELINGKVDLDVRNEKGETALIASINKGFLRFAEILIKAGTNLNFSDSNRQTPLHRATQNNFISIVDILLKHKCDVNLADHMGDTSLHIASGRGFLDIVKMILAAPGVEPKKFNNQKYTPYHCAMESGFPQVVHTLLVTKYLPTRDKHDHDHEQFGKLKKTPTYDLLDNTKSDISPTVSSMSVSSSRSSQKYSPSCNFKPGTPKPSHHSMKGEHPT